MKKIQLYLLLTLGINILYAKNIHTYCFESPYIFIGKEHVKRLKLTFDDNNFSEEYQIDVPLYFTLDNDKTYPSDPPNCYYEGNETFNCNQEMDGAGYLEFDPKKKRINIEHLCTFECYVHITVILEDGTMIVEESHDNKSVYPKEGNLNTMFHYENINNEDEKVWVEGYRCDIPINKKNYGD